MCRKHPHARLVCRIHATSSVAIGHNCLGVLPFNIDLDSPGASSTFTSCPPSVFNASSPHPQKFTHPWLCHPAASNQPLACSPVPRGSPHPVPKHLACRLQGLPAGLHLHWHLCSWLHHPPNSHVCESNRGVAHVRGLCGSKLQQHPASCRKCDLDELHEQCCW